MARILVVDDEPVVLNLLNKILSGEGYEVTPVDNGEAALAELQQNAYDLLVSDIRMEAIDGMEVLRRARNMSPDTGVIMLTAYGSVNSAVEAMKEGAFDYITKPFKLDELLVTVQRALEYYSVLIENKGLKNQLETKTRLTNIIAESPAMRKVCDMVERVAPTSTTVLIYGESGTGKELVARALHSHSPRANNEFMPVNCAALPENLMESEMFGHVKGAFTGASSDKTGLFEAASGGTLFLDEIGAMPLNIQSKLLRALQDKVVRKVGGTKNVEVDVRLVAASNSPLEDLIREGRFREDLYYRLSVITIEIPPLRDRPEDLLPLAKYLMRREIGPDRELPTLDHEARHILENYGWPGNVRELENAIRHALTFEKEGVITRESLPAKIVESVQQEGVESPSRAEEYKGKSLKAFLRSKEKEYLQNVIDSTGGNKEEAARALGISLATLYRKLSD
ncbi:sigma-54-dependent transcriptional regulator [Kiritimatiella glycovorans]|uniref:Fis family transcriptional regulator n=1 Tax=Kiritimatiella glycovorans TaxID=1307763 RepID=A0A0G3EDR7_9BACT|nr:sigma-54 dependent transcriptional regulator [Kiritimatiella glycovorans]AKJ63547.1 Fis family transcriptional regulator [Kiritimatiella glycovorans]